MDNRYSPSALEELKERVEKRRWSWLQVTLRELEKAQFEYQQEPTDEELTLALIRENPDYDPAELAELREKDRQARWKALAAAEHEVAVAKEEYQEELSLPALARIQSAIDDNYITLSCKIAETRAENYLRHCRGNKAEFFRKKLKEPPTCLDDEEIKALERRAKRRRFY